MKKILYLIPSFIYYFLFLQVSFSQVNLEWVRYNSGPAGSITYNQIIQADPVGNTYIAGTFINNPQWNCFSYKYSPSGAMGNYYQSSHNMQPTCLWIDKFFNAYAGGYYYQQGIKQLVAVKFTAGGIAWEYADSLYGYGGNLAL
jgi:hypothetical protein